MQEELKCQKNTSNNLKKSLDTTQQELKDTMEKYRIELAYHHELLKRQQEALRLLYKSKFRNDFLLDCSILLGSAWLSGSIIVDLPVKIILSTIFGSASSSKSRFRAFLLALIRIAVTWQSYRTVRNEAQRYGLHNGLGSWIPYVNNWILQRQQNEAPAALLPPPSPLDSYQ